MTKTLAEIATSIRDIDFCTLTTVTDGGALSGRPMSNNREVEYDGDSWFFADASARFVQDLASKSDVGLGYQGKAGMLGLRPFFVTVEGRGEVIRDKTQFAAHWHKELERWRPDGIDTPGIVLVKVRASRVHYWDGEDEGEIVVG